MGQGMAVQQLEYRKKKMKVSASQNRKGMKLVGVQLIVTGLVVASAHGTTYPDATIIGPSSQPTFPAAFEAFDPAVHSDPVSTNVPAIAEWTRSNNPGDTMALTGSRLSIFSDSAEGRDTRFVLFGQSGAGKITADALIQRLDGMQAAITLPEELPADQMYLMWPRNSNGFSKPVAINRTEAWWVGPDLVSRGESFSVYGRNLKLGNKDCYLYIDGYGWITNTTANPYKADFVVPSDLANGTYTVYVHNGHGREYGWADGIQITVQDHERDWSRGVTIDVTDAPYNATGDGSTDDHAAIKDAFGDAGYGDTVYFPAGTYLSSYDLFPPNGARILGDGMDSSIIKPHSSNGRSQFIRASDDTFFKEITFASNDDDMKFWYGGGSQRVTWENVRFDQRANRAEYDTCLFFPTAGHLTFKNCEFYQSDNIWIGDAEQIFFDGCMFAGMNDLNTFITSNAKEVSLFNSTCANYDDSNPTNGYGWAVGRWFVGQGHGVDGNPMLTYFGGNSMTNLGPRFPAARFTGDILAINGAVAHIEGLAGQTGLDTTMEIQREGPRSYQFYEILSIDLVAGTITIDTDWDNIWTPDPIVGDPISIVDEMDANSGEIFMTESLPPLLRANPVSATANTVVFSSTPQSFIGHVAAIVDGKGMGQTRLVTGHAGSTLTLDEDWNVIPDTGSLIIVGECAYRMVAYDNIFNGGGERCLDPKRFVGNPAVQPYGMASDWIVDGNTMTDLRIGIADYLWVEPLGSHHTVTPNYFNYYANNTISNCYHGIWRNLRLADTATQIYEDAHSLGTMFRNNSIEGSLHRAIDCEQLPGSHTIPADIIHLTVFDNNTVFSNEDFFYGREGFFNQVWVGNQIDSANGGTGLTHLNESSILRNNIWNGFDSNYGVDSSGPILGLPTKVVDETATEIPILNCGTDPLAWSARTDANWVNLTVDGGSVFDENSTGMLTFKVDASAVPEGETKAVITVSSDAGQEQQMTVEYSAVPPPPDPPPAPVLTGIVVSGPSSMDEEATAQYLCTASYSDGTTAAVAATWSENSAYASISASGVLTAGNVSADQSATVTASFGGLTDTYTVTIKYVEPVLTGIVISGSSSVYEETTAQYVCTANYSDGTSVVVTPIWSENSSSTTISSSGLLSVGNISADKVRTITANFEGETDTFSVTLKYVAPVLTGIVISGSSIVNEETTAQYVCTASYSDGTTGVVTPVWSENSSYATISGSGVLTAGNVTANKSLTITASFGGKTDTHAVTITYIVPVLAGITVSGPSIVDEESIAQYICTARYSDGTSKVVVPVWSENSSYATINSSGVLTAGNVSADQTVTLTASYGGKSDTHSVFIKFVAPPVVVESLVIAGPGSMEENTTAQYVCTAHYSDGTSGEVVPAWSDNSAQASINGSGLLTASNVSTDASVTITASFAGKIATKVLVVMAIGDQVVLPLSGFDGKTVLAELWDQTAQQWIPLGEEFEPSELVIENVASDQWYWVGLSEYDEDADKWILVHGRWIMM